MLVTGQCQQHPAVSQDGHLDVLPAPGNFAKRKTCTVKAWRVLMRRDVKTGDPSIAHPTERRTMKSVLKASTKSPHPVATSRREEKERPREGSGR